MGSRRTDNQNPKITQVQHSWFRHEGQGYLRSQSRQQQGQWRSFRNQKDLLTERGLQLSERRKHSRSGAVTGPGKDLIMHFRCPFSTTQPFFRFFCFSQGPCSLSLEPIFLTLQLCLRYLEDSKWTRPPINRAF